MGQTEKIIAGLEPPALEGLTRAPFPRSKFYTSSIAKAHKLGYPVLNCLLCKYRTRNDDGTPYCEKTGMVVKVESEAINCSNYLYDEKRRNRFIESYKQFEYLGLNLWERNHNHKIIKFC